MHSRSRLATLRVSFFPHVVGPIAYPLPRTSLTLTSTNQARHRSRLALQPFLCRSVLLYVGSVDKSTPRVCSWDQETRACPALVGRVPLSTCYCIAYCKCSALFIASYITSDFHISVLSSSGRQLWCLHPYYGQRFVGGNTVDGLEYLNATRLHSYDLLYQS